MNYALYDRSALRHRLLDDDGLVAVVLAEFLSDMPRQIANLQAAVEAGDATASHRHAHTIKGAAANVGALMLSEQARRLEQSCAGGHLLEAVALLPSLRECWRDTQAAIEAPLPPAEGRKPV